MRKKEEGEKLVVWAVPWSFPILCCLKWFVRLTHGLGDVSCATHFHCLIVVSLKKSFKNVCKMYLSRWFFFLSVQFSSVKYVHIVRLPHQSFHTRFLFRLLSETHLRFLYPIKKKNSTKTNLQFWFLRVTVNTHSRTTILACKVIVVKRVGSGSDHLWSRPGSLPY